jgi:uncharacterized protein
MRSALAAIGNAEALPLPAAPAGAAPARAGSPYVAGSVAGLRATEARRRPLSETEMAAILGAEITERRAAAEQYERAGHADQAERLRREADALAAVDPA